MKKLFLFIAALMLGVGLWAETVEYRYPVYNITNDPTCGIKEWKTGSVEATEVTSSDTKVTWNAGWYVVKGTDVQLAKGAACKGAVNLILADGAKLTATGGESQAGIQVSGTGYTLKIYGQTNQSGQLIATGGLDAAGIGGGEDESGTNIIINGGKVTATGGEYAACIGGGSKGDGSNIIINGGEVTAICAYNNCGAGIGGGFCGDGSNITINGGIVSATGGSSSGAGIGGGQTSIGSNITINDGKVIATGGSSGGAGIGGGSGREGFDITINGGEVIATGGKEGAGIGGGMNGKGYNITITDGTVTATGGDDAAGIGGGGNATGIGGEERGAGSNITIKGGKVTANGGTNAAGIGGGFWSNGSYITINGGEVTAIGVAGGAGIGGGVCASGSNITINGGKVIATGGILQTYLGEGIGSGWSGSGSYNIKVAINLIVEAGNNENPTEVIAPNRKADDDIAGYLHEKRYATITDPLPAIKEAAIAEINDVANDAKEEIDGLGVDESAKSDAKAQIDNIVNTAKQTINAATSKDAIDNAKTQAIADIHNVVQTTKDMWVTVRENMTINNYGTLCWNYNLTDIEGAELYTVAGIENGRIIMEEVLAEETEAGAGYIILATAETLRVKNGLEYAQYPVHADECNGLQGTFEEIADGAAGTAGNQLEGNYIVYNNEWRKCGGFTGLQTNRAYLIMNYVPGIVSAPAPGRKYISMPLPKETPTDLNTVDGAQCTMHNGKYIINGQFIIVKDGKKINAQGIEL